MLKMRKIKIKKTSFKVIDKATKQVLKDGELDGKLNEKKVIIEFIKEFGYRSNLDVEVIHQERMFVISEEDIIKHGEEITN